MVDTSFRKIMRFLLSLLLVLSVAATLLSCVLRYALLDRTAYAKAAHSPSLVDSVHTALLNRLESECLFYDLPFETLKAAVSKDVVETLATSQTSVIYDALFHGAPLPKVEWDGAALTRTIQSFFDTLPEQDQPTEDAAKVIADDLINSMSPILSVGLSDKLLMQGHNIIKKLSLLQSFAAITVWLALLSAVLAVGLWLITPKSTPQRLQTVFGMTFFGSALVAVPFWLLWWYDLPSRLVLSESALKQFVNGVLYRIVDYSVTVTSIVFAVSAVLLFTAVVLRVRKMNKSA